MIDDSVADILLDENNSMKTQDLMLKLGDKVDKAILSALEADEIGQLFIPE